MNKQNPAFGVLLRLFSRQKGRILFTFLAAVGSSLSAVFSIQYIGFGVEAMLGQGQVDFPRVGSIILTLGVLYFVGAFCSWLVAALSSTVAHTTVGDLRNQLFGKLGRLPLAYYDQNPHGDILSRFVSDLDSISDALSLSLVSLFTGIVTVVAVLFLMLYHSPQITVVVLLTTPLNFVAVWIVTRVSQSTFRQQQNIVGDLSGLVTEMIGNQKTVLALGYEEASIERFRKINQQLNKTGRSAHFASAMVNPSTRIVDHISYVLVGVIGGVIAIDSGQIGVGVVSMFLMFSSQFAKPFNELSGIMSNLQTAAASLVRVQSILEEPQEHPDATDAITLTAPKGQVEFENVSFSYSPDVPLISGLNIKAAPGELVAIVGPTGAGKTTIVNLLMRFYEINSGNILIDGINSQQITKDSLRRSFGMVLQDTWLTHGTVAENISYGRPTATFAEIKQAAKAAHADSFIRQLPQGYQTVLSEDGGRLSVGQKQLLTISRVMLTNPTMLLLDEATSSIDTLTEQRVQQVFLSMMKGRTSFVIAHRLSTIEKADTILVLDHGKVVETGTHQQLLAKKGFYHSLYQSQFE